MAYPLDVAAQNNVLDALLGKRDTMPDSFEVALFNAHPDLGGTELDATGGYARVVIANDATTWPGAASGLETSITVAFPTPTAAWSDTATHYLLIDAADSTTRYFPGRLVDEVAVDGTETSAPSAQLAAFWNTTSL